MGRNWRSAEFHSGVISQTAANPRTLSLLALLLVFVSISAFAVDSTPVSTQANATVDRSSSEARTCASCHADVVQHFAGNPHDRDTSTHNPNGDSCSDCHGSGKAHIESGGDKSRIFDPAAAATSRVNDMCLNCHKGSHLAYAQSIHGRANLSCTACHSIHTASPARYLLKAREPQLCFQCHADVKPDFSLPYRHKVEEGLLTCSDCHDSHATQDQSLAGKIAQQDKICTNCHTRMAGPFVYEHAIVKAEGCTACHLPHGSPNPKLLSRANVNTICLFCHMPSFNSAKPGDDMALVKIHTEQSRSCISCHSDVHGSTTSPVFLDKKAGH
jgi:DmsE family decaheme c-type cytochrome